MTALNDTAALALPSTTAPGHPAAFASGHAHDSQCWWNPTLGGWTCPGPPKPTL